MADNLTLGRGELWFARYIDGTTTPGGERYIGNSPEFNVTIETETLDHYNSDHGVNEKDKSIILQTNRTGTFTTDNIHPENLALFFLGKAGPVTSAAATGLTNTFQDVGQDLAYQLGMSTTNPSGARNVSNVVVSGGSSGSTAQAGVDYVIDPALGRITILPGSMLIGSDITVTFDVAASTRQQVISGATPVKGALRYVSFNPEGEKFDYYMPEVSLSPNGDFALKGDEWQAIPFTVDIQKKAPYEAIYIDGRPLTSG